MKLLRMIMILAILTAILIPNQTAAQDTDRRIMMERLIGELEVTDEVLQRAKDIVRESDDEKGITILKIAFERQSWAKSQLAELGMQFRLRLYSAAVGATQKAREQARNAIAAVRRTDRHEGVVARRLERTAELLERVQQAVRDHPERNRLQELYDTALRSLKRAREFFQQSKYRPALKLSNQAANAANRILRALQAGRPGVEHFERRQEGLNRKIEEARERLDCDWVEELLDEAEQAYLEAMELAEQDQLEAANRHLQKGNELVGLAIRNCAGAEEIDRAIERLKTGVAELKEQELELEGAQKDSFDAMLRRAQEQIELAENSASQNQYEAAKIAIQAAIKALNQAKRLANLN